MVSLGSADSAAASPAPVSSTPIGPAAASPAPVSSTPVSRAAASPAPVKLTPVSPAAASLASVSLATVGPAATDNLASVVGLASTVSFAADGLAQVASLAAMVIPAPPDNGTAVERAMMRSRGLRSGRSVLDGKGQGRESFRSSGPPGRPVRFLGRCVLRWILGGARRPGRRVEPGGRGLATTSPGCPRHRVGPGVTRCGPPSRRR